MKNVDIFPKKSVMIVLLCVVFFLMVFMALSIKNQKNMSSIPQPGSTKQLQTQSNSTETLDIEKDLNETDLSDLDKEVNDIENELNQP